MHHRIVSYTLLITTTAAVLLVMVIQPREATLRKKKLKDMRVFLVAQITQTCGPGGMDGGCAPPPITPFGGGGSSSGGSSGSSSGGSTTNGISPKEKERITTECLEYLTQPPSGYAEVEREYGLFTNILNSAVNSCENAYLSAQGKFGSSDLYLVYDLLLGLLYQAFQKTPAPLKGQSIADYINPDKEGTAAHYLQCLARSISTFAGTTSVSPKYLANPLPDITAKNATEYNKSNSPAIISVEEDLAVCLPAEPKTEEVVVVAEPVVKKIEPAPAPQVKAPALPVEPEAPSLRQFTQTVLGKIKLLFRSIREMPPMRKAVSPKFGLQKRNFERQVKILNAFNEAHHTLCVKQGRWC